MTDVTAASSTDRWWLQDQYRDQFDAGSREGGQMAPRTWENRPDEGERFKTFLAGLNPLHHIPGVNLVYRELTGEKVDAGQQVLGGALFGGVIGLISGLFNAAVSSSTGKDIAGTVMGIFDTGDKAPATPSAVAANPAPPPAVNTRGVMPAAAAERAAPAPAAPSVVPLGADGKLPDVLDLDAIAPAAGPSTAPAKPLANVPAAPGAPVTVAAADERRWFPARGRENPRAVSTVVPPTPPALMSLQNVRAEGRVPVGAATPQGLPFNQGLPAGMQMPAGVPVSNRAGAGAYGSALELSRELQKHYLGAQ